MALAAGAIVVARSGEQKVNEVESPPAMLRRSANYQPSTWDYNSVSSLRTLNKAAACTGGGSKQLANSNKLGSVHSVLIERVRQLLLNEQENLAMKLGIIDQLQRLGVAYHFDEEIESILNITLSTHDEAGHHGLKDAFDLLQLRGQGVRLPIGMLNASGDQKNNDDFSSGNPAEDIDGLQAPSFTGHGPRERHHEPLNRRVPRLQAIKWLKQCFDDEGKGCSIVDPTILQLATIDFNLVQAAHRGELAKITKWWKESGLGEKQAFARERVVECFFCATCIAPEPHLAECREVLAKVGTLLVHLDDIYDVHGTLDELEAFTHAIERWGDVSPAAAAASLPEYMKAMYSAIVTTSVTAAGRVLEKQGYDVLPLYKKGWHELCKAFLMEARWQAEGIVPSFEEYLSNGWVTSTGPLLLLHALPTVAHNKHHIMSMLMSNNGSSNVAIDYPRQVELSSRIFRLCNDCATHEAESERGDAPSSIACYMEETAVGEEEARAAVEDAIAELWKELDQEVVAFSGGSKMNDPCSAASLSNLCLNLARTVHCIYLDGDGITEPTDRVKQLVNDLLFNAVPEHPAEPSKGPMAFR